MKKLAIIGVVLIGGLMFECWMFENNKQVSKPKVQQEVTSSSKDVKNVTHIDSKKTKSDITNTKDLSNPSENNKTLNSDKIIKNNENENLDVKDNIENKSDIENSNHQNLQVKDNTVNKVVVENSNHQNLQISKSQIKENNTSQHSKKEDNNKSSDIRSQSINKNIIKNSSSASNLVRKYYQNKYPSINQSDWSTDVIENQTIDGKTGYLVRLYDYMNSHSNNIAWILVEQNGNMYSTQAGSGPLVKLN